MKQLVISSTLLGLAAWTPAWATAQEVGQVLSRSAVMQPVAVPRQTCTASPAVVHSSSGAGALMGAIAGGAMGNAVGDGSGRALATMIGIVGGAMVGDRIEGSGQASPQNHTTCTTQTVYENRLVGYDVVYEYAGKQYRVQLPQDPGPTISLNISPVGQTLQSAAPPPVQHATVIHTPAQVVYVPAPVYRTYPPVYTHIDLNWGNQRLVEHRPVVRHPGYRYPSERPHGPRYKVREDRHHWR
jgi:uncharacterized protein YcfJ